MKNIAISFFNQFVPYHETYPTFADQYSGRIFCIRLIKPQIELYGVISQSGIHLSHPDIAMCEIELNIPAILKMIGIHHPNAKTIIEGDSRFALCLMKQLSLRSINIHYLLSKITKPRYRVALTEILKYCAQSLQYCSAETQSQLVDYLINDLGICLDEETNSKQYEEIIRLKWLIEELKHHMSNSTDKI